MSDMTDAFGILELKRISKKKENERTLMEKVCRIMIIDDEFIMRQGIRFMMKWEEEGYEIAGEASNGKEALDLIPALRPHIILCDIAMPIMNGLDFIKIVHREYPDIKLIVLSGYDNFEYVREALLNGAADYVLKPTLNPEELLKIVSTAAKKIPNLELGRKEFSSIDNMMECYLTGEVSEFDVSMEEFWNVFPHSCFRIFILPLFNRDSSQVNMSSVLYEKTEKFLKGLSYCKNLKFLKNQETLYVVFNYDVKDEEQIKNDLSAFMGQMGLLAEHVIGTLGKRHTRLEDVKAEFGADGFMERESFYNRGIHLYEIKNGVSIGPSAERFDYRRFTAAIGAGRYHEAVSLFRDYITKSVQNQMPEFKLKNQTKNLLYNLIGSLENHVQELEAIRSEYFMKIEQAAYCDNFMKVYEEMLSKLEAVIGDQKENQDIYLKKILGYIQVHYAEELNLQSLAETFNFSYSYLSAYFNQHASEGFSEYLNRVRIQKACDFLENSRMSIAQVSSAVGYSDHSYFCRVFKKITGSTPSVYRREGR